MTQNLRRAILALVIAIPSTAGAQTQQGDARTSDQLSRARALVQQRRFKAALATFDSLLRATPGSREAELGRAQMLAWTGRLVDAIRAYQRWVEAHPKDIEAVELFALALTWADRLDEAERLYKVLALAEVPGAERGLARLLARRGDLAGAERQWRAIVAKRPNDVEAWVGLGHVLRWRNRPREARTAFGRAVQLQPSNHEAREQLLWVEAALAPRIEPTFASLDDSDGNRLTTIGATAAVAPPWDGDVSLRGQRRATIAGGSRGSSLSATVAASRHIGQLTVRASAGTARLDDGTAGPGALTRDVLTGSATASARVTRRLHVGAGVGREPFDETAALIRRGIVTTTVGGGATIDGGRGLTFAGAFEHVELTGATPNSRRSGTASLTWRAPFVLSLGANARAFGYASDPSEGYFAPRSYVLGEATAQIAIGRQLGWSMTVDGGVGAQSIDLRAAGSETQLAGRGGLSLLYRPTPGLEWSVSTTSSNAASSATSGLSSYRTSGMSMRARVSF